MEIGKYSIDLVQTGHFGLDGGAMFGVVPKPLWEKHIPADEKNRIILGARMPVLRSGSRTILIDTGIGEFWDDKFEEIYAVDHSQHDLFSSLKSVNVKPEEVTDVILTHLHFDHTGGSVIRENGKWLPAFPNAKYHINKKQFDWAKEPSFKDKASFAQERFLPLAKEGLVSYFEGDTFLDDEIELLEANGHTFGHVVVKLKDSSNSYLFCSDLIPTAAHVPLPYLMGFDLQPVLTVEEKTRFLKHALEENTTLLFQHDTVYAGATLKSGSKGIETDKLFR